ncbi:hypothetical protein KFE25_012912 [Diacronema lutheri]|uniref:Rhodanese domain-containing protein n=1 Tax=Diacronema lutheri TaxID=2081491 RepID=A0A8J5X698_DIALT|nr:hypothetical protein KFE25_012912 [Diacronema lutheri]
MVGHAPRLMLETVPFVAPSWARHLRAQPEASVCLGMLPTPVHAWRPPCLDAGGLRECLVKRDDLSGGVELGGNKVRKLELLLAEALAQGADTVVTIGGVQSNHARATAVGARLLGLDACLVLRVADRAAAEPVGFAANLLFGRLAGATVRTVTKSEYAAHGSAALLRRQADALAAAGRRPFVIPVGGSCARGTWGYIAAVAELVEQLAGRPAPDHIVVACGSGGTACGLALGARLAGLRTRVHAVGVCDTPDAFYEHVARTAAELGVELGEGGARGLLTVHQGKGLGYALSTPAELGTIARTAAATGVTLDGAYTGKALHAFAQLACAEPRAFVGSSVLFWHTGGALAMTGGLDALEPLMPAGQVGPLLIGGTAGGAAGERRDADGKGQVPPTE